MTLLHILPPPADHAGGSAASLQALQHAIHLEHSSMGASSITLEVSHVFVGSESFESLEVLAKVFV